MFALCSEGQCTDQNVRISLENATVKENPRTPQGLSIKDVLNSHRPRALTTANTDMPTIQFKEPQVS